MLFKLILAVRDFPLAEGQAHEFAVGGTYDIQVLLHASLEGQGTMCVVTSQFEPNKGVRRVFERLNQEGEDHPDVKADKDTETLSVDQNDKITGKVGLFFSLPQHFQDFQHQLYNELDQVATHLINVIRWMCGREGAHNFLRQISFQWSVDGIVWKEMPVGYILDLSVQRPFTLGVEGAEQRIVELARRVQGEPLGHTLFREAWEQKDHNLRSALVMGIVALEIGVKQFVSTLVPANKWLIENVPSPSMEKILSEYLPQLPTHNTFEGKVLPPPRDVMSSIKKGVKLRNEAVHVGSHKPPKKETIEEILLAVRDVLWLLDYYCGYTWGLKYMRPETRTALETQGSLQK